MSPLEQQPGQVEFFYAKQRIIKIRDQSVTVGCSVIEMICEKAVAEMGQFSPSVLIADALGFASSPPTYKILYGLVENTQEEELTFNTKLILKPGY